MKNPLFAPMSVAEWAVASPGIALVVLGAIALDNAWPGAFWVLFAGIAYQGFALSAIGKGWFAKKV